MRLLRAASRNPFAPKPLVCIGHSHTENIVDAAREAKIGLDALNFWHLPNPFVTEGGIIRLAPAIRARLAAPVFSLVGGAVHQDIGLVLHPRPFDFVWPGNPDLPMHQGAEAIPFDAVRGAMLERTRYYMNIMDAVRDTVKGHVFHIESPPPYEHELVPENDPGFEHFFGRNAAFSPVWLRYKLWRVHSGIIAQHCLARGIGFIPHPPQSVTACGFLRDGLNGKPGHANAQYGALVLAQMLQAVRPGSARAPAAEAGPRA